MYILGIDTSCDDTSAAVLHDQTILSNVVSSQITLHQPYGGVFPTVAKLAHQQNIAPVVALALKRSGLSPTDLTAVAVTQGPGLAPALEVGINYARDFATQNRLPLIPVNHLEGHLLSSLLQPNSRNRNKKEGRREDQSQYLCGFRGRSRSKCSEAHLECAEEHFEMPSSAWQPCNPENRANNAIGLIISGGHSSFVRIDSIGQYDVIGQTLDDAAGEALDKIGRLLGLGYPAAPVVEQLAKEGDPHRFPFPLPLTTRHDFDLSFSGLKTHASNLVTSLTARAPLSRQDITDLAASTQTGVFRHLLYKFEKLLTAEKKSESHILAGGGVINNVKLRHDLRLLAKKYGYHVHFPYSQRLCGDNAAMIALCGFWRFKLAKNRPAFPDFDRQPNLPLTSWR